jgi:hypothetical protein
MAFKIACVLYATTESGIDSTTAPDVLYLTDHEAIDPGDDILSYMGAVIVGSPTNVSSGSTSTIEVDSMVMETSSPIRAAYDTDGNGTTDSDFQAGAGVIVVDRNNPGRGVACGAIETVDLANSELVINIASGTLGTLTGTAILVAVPAVEYRVTGGTLFRNGQRMALGVEDLQVAYLFDFDADGVTAASEVRGGASGTAYAANGESVEDLRQIRLNLVTRTRIEDARFPAGVFRATENRGAVAGNDGFRRRVNISTIMPRNLVNRIDTT